MKAATRLFSRLSIVGSAHWGVDERQYHETRFDLHQVCIDQERCAEAPASEEMRRLKQGMQEIARAWPARNSWSMAALGNRGKFDNGFSVFGDDHRLRFGQDFVQDGDATGFENAGRYRFLMLP